MIPLSEIVAVLGPLSVFGPMERSVSNVVVLGPNDEPAVLAWCNAKNLANTAAFRQGVLIVPTTEGIELAPEVTYLVCEEPRRAFQAVLEKFFAPQRKVGIHSTAIVLGQVGEASFIGPGVVIEPGVTLGDEVSVDANTVIKSGTVIGDRVQIGANCTIGGTGFGYEKDIDGQYLMIPHVGGVILEDGVEVGNNTAIDRAVLGATILRKNVKVDNLVHIAHGCDIGENSLIIAHAMIAGSTSIGPNVWVAPCAAVINKTSVGEGAVVGMGAVVTKPVEDGDVVVGNPARSLKKRD